MKEAVSRLRIVMEQGSLPQPFQEAIPVMRLQDIHETILGTQVGDAGSHCQEMQIVVTQHRQRPVT